MGLYWMERLTVRSIYRTFKPCVVSKPVVVAPNAEVAPNPVVGVDVPNAGVAVVAVEGNENVLVGRAGAPLVVRGISGVVAGNCAGALFKEAF
jgi:hypothetical protein